MAEYTYELNVLQPVFEAAFGLPPGGLADPTLNPFWAPRISTGEGATYPFNDFNSVQDTESRAVFAQGTWHVNGRVRLTAGARYTSDEKDVIQTRGINIAPGGCADLEQSESWDETTWKLGADYDVSERVMLYAGVSRGFHAGGFNGGSCGDEYDPETLLAYEAGIKSQFADQRAQLNVAAFYYDYDDYQARLFVDQMALVENAAKATVQGIEVEFLVNPFAGLELDGSAAWLDGEFDEFVADNPMTPGMELVDLEGNKLLRSPEYSFNLGAQYHWELGARGSLVARYEVAHKDDYELTTFNDDFTRIDAYTVHNARLSWDDGGAWELHAFVENLTDEDYLESIISTPLVGGALGMWALPRTWGVQVTYRAGAAR